MNEIQHFIPDFKEEPWINSPKIDAGFQVKNIPYQPSYSAIVNLPSNWLYATAGKTITLWFRPRLIMISAYIDMGNVESPYFSKFNTTHYISEAGAINYGHSINFRRGLTWEFMQYNAILQFIYIRKDWGWSNEDITMYFSWASDTWFSFFWSNPSSLNTVCTFTVFW